MLFLLELALLAVAVLALRVFGWLGNGHPDNAICGDYGGGGNRTRVTSGPETGGVQEERVAGTDDDPRLAGFEDGGWRWTA